MKKDGILKKAATGIAIVIAGVIIGVVMLACVYKIPQGRIYTNTETSIEILHEEKVYPKLLKGLQATQLDNWTDALMLNMTYYKSDSFADDMLLSKYINKSDADNPVESFYSYMSGEEGEYNQVSYGRYWHGYQVVLAPLLMFFNITSIRYLNMACQICAVFAVVLVLAEKKRKDMIIPYIIMWMSLAPVVLFFSMQFSTTFYVMSCLSLVVAVRSDKYSLAKMCVAFEIAGIVEAYVDFLTYPLVALGIPIIMWLAMNMDTESALKEKMHQLMSLAGAWVCGYIGMWSGKWLVATLFTKDNIVMNAVEAFKVRSSTHQGETTFSYIDAVIRNIGVYRSRAFAVLFVVAVLIWLLGTALTRKPIYTGRQQTITMVLLCAMMPFGWYMVTINHSYVHFWFTFRELVVSIYGMFTALYMGMCPNKRTVTNVV